MGNAEQQEYYRLPKRHLLRFPLAVLLGQRRDLGADAREALKAARPQPRARDERHIPEEGAFVLIANHYERPGLKVWWGGMLMSTAVYERPRRHRTLRWLMTSEWYNFRLGGLIPIPVWFLRWLFRRLASVYGLVIVPRSPERRVGRAAAMRAILDVIQSDGEPIALYPEGTGEDVLKEALPGTGVFMLSLSKRGIPIVPCGIYEEEGVLTARFGPPFSIELPADTPKDDRDRLAREQMMSHIGRLLPRPMWGPYTLAVEQLLARGPAV